MIMAIKNHRALKTWLIENLPLSANRERSILDIKRASILFNGKDIHTITAGMDHPENQLIFETACDEVLKGTLNIERRRHYQEFLRLYLHTNGILAAGLASIQQQLEQRGYGVRNSGVKQKISVYLKNKDLYIEDEFFFREFEVRSETARATRVEEGVRIFTPEPYDYLVCSKTQFKLEVIEQHGVCVPRLVILQSTLDCPDPYFRKMIDERSFLEKLIDFLKAIFRIATHTTVPVSTFFKPPGNASSVQSTNLPQVLNSAL